MPIYHFLALVTILLVHTASVVRCKVDSDACESAINTNSYTVFTGVQTATNLPDLNADQLFTDRNNPKWKTALATCTCTAASYMRFTNISQICQYTPNETANDVAIMKDACNTVNIPYESISGMGAGGGGAGTGGQPSASGNAAKAVGTGTGPTAGATTKSNSDKTTVAFINYAAISVYLISFLNL